MKNEHHPLSPTVIVSGLIITVLGGLIVAWLVSEGGKFIEQPTQVVQQIVVVITATPPSKETVVIPSVANTATPAQQLLPTAISTPVPTSTQSSNLLPNGESVSPASLSKLVGGTAAYWTQRRPVVWGYWDKSHDVTFHHPGNNMVITYWAGFAEPRNAEGCSIVIPSSDNLTRYVKCPAGTRAEFEADGVGLHLVDYTDFFP